MDRRTNEHRGEPRARIACWSPSAANMTLPPLHQTARAIAGANGDGGEVRVPP